MLLVLVSLPMHIDELTRLFITQAILKTLRIKV